MWGKRVPQLRAAAKCHGEPFRKKQRVAEEVPSSVLHNLNDDPDGEPPRKKQRVTAEVPSAVLHNPNDDSGLPESKCLGFISCPENFRLDIDAGLQKVKDSVLELIGLGSEFISVTCAKPGMDMSRILHDVKPVIDNKLVSVGQPDARPSYSCTKTSISFWSNSFATCSVSPKA